MDGKFTFLPDAAGLSRLSLELGKMAAIGASEMIDEVLKERGSPLCERESLRDSITSLGTQALFNAAVNFARIHGQTATLAELIRLNSLETH